MAKAEGADEICPEHRGLLDRFLIEHETVKEWSSKGNYASDIGIFLKWLNRTGTSLERLTRNRFDQFTAHLVERQVSIEARWRTRNQV